jgi:glycosyltransferase involved in cell wall biosynthesis
MKRLFLLFHGRFPSEKAASLFAAKGAEAFAHLGLKVTVVVPKRRRVVESDPFGFYNIDKVFDVVYLPTTDLFGTLPNKLAFLISFVSFSISSYFFLKKNSSNEDIIYSNETLPLYRASFIRPNCFYEMHDFPESKLRLFSQLLKRMRWVLVHNKWKFSEIDKKFPTIVKDKFIYEPNAVDVNAFDIGMSKREARQKLNLSQEKILAVYTGHLYEWKGVETLAEAASFLGDRYLIVFVGGTEKDVAIFKQKYASMQNIRIVGHRSHQEIPVWQQAADVLVLPNTGKVAISTHYTSPMKMFEYMASRRPIVASNIPSITEILNQDNAVLVPPDEPKFLADAIESLVGDPNKTASISDQAYNDVLPHTWDARASRILDFINK